jgi:hypothetical protein
MEIWVTEIPTCTWVLDGDSFYCAHDEVDVVKYTNMYMTVDGPDEYETEGYECAECGKPLEGYPAEDRTY